MKKERQIPALRPTMRGGSIGATKNADRDVISSLSTGTFSAPRATYRSTERSPLDPYLHLRG